MPVRYTGGGGGAVCPPTFTLTDKEQHSDVLTLNPLKLVDTEQHSDSIKLNPLQLTDTIQRGDIFKLPTIAATMTETKGCGTDTFKAAVSWPTQARSGTPDTDAWGDAWIDGVVANQGVNHGSDAALTVANATVASESRGLIEFDLTRFTGFTANGTSTLTLTATNASTLVAANLNAEFCTHTTVRPFTESTVAWSTTGASTDPPFSSTSVVTLTSSLAAAATNATVTLTLSAANVNSLLGKWVVILFKADSLSTGFTVVSREGATVGQRAQLALNITR